MSFKRDGDDVSLLNLLKHERVSALLGSHIPEDEAKLLSNGRLTCIVCHHRPIFDTVLMLGNHRKGRRHILELSRFLKRKQELELVEQKEAVLKAADRSQLGGRPEEQRRSEPPGARRRVLDLCLFAGRSQASLKEMSPVRSDKSQVRDYLKSLTRKRPLDQFLEEQRGSYPPEPPPSQPTLQVTESEPTIDTECNVVASANNGSSQPPKKTEFSFNLSGWIRDKHGEWIKDPNAEFDSDDENPPTPK